MNAKHTPGPWLIRDGDEWTHDVVTLEGVDCAHIDRCKAMFGHVETDTYCDWSPSRFQQAKAGGAA